MSRFTSIAIAILAIFSCPYRSDAASPPNVVFLFADDQRADTVGALGNRAIQTPNLDRMVKRGVSFNRFYMQGGLNGATCVPSRAMLLSGRNLFAIDEKLVRDETWPAAFGRQGYETFISGKWHNGANSIRLSFQMARQIFDGGMTDPMHAKLSDMVNGKLAPSAIPKKHACEVFADEAIRFIEQPHDKPYFCYVPFDAPHDPHIVPDDFPIHYAPDQIELPPNFLAQHPFDNGEMTIRDELLLDWPRDPERTRQLLADYYRYISYLDSQIGRILDAIESSPDSQNTIVVFSADSGVARGSHGLIGKQNCYEHSLRVPLIINGPGIPQNVSSSSLGYLFDVLPTIGKLCNVEGPTTSQGREFTEALFHPERAHRSQLVFGYKSIQRAMVDERWKLIAYPQINYRQLFDLQSDPYETIDLAKQPEHAERIKNLEDQMRKQLTEMGDRSPLSVLNPKPAMWSPPSK